ncbi:cell division control protein [Mucor ambiguus]|uniref:non-specific serine/threonine protein kinase n=1 Tax=Mucor ambiguus TaxID=91626 RepID=A0A0C9N103_9FUNG|nr:cell division control protein [Mucor ambiguus]
MPMDSRGIPIVLPAKKCNTTPKRITTPKRYETPLSPFFVRSMKNEFSLLDAYDDFYDSRFSSRYHPTSDDMRHNVRDLYKSIMFTEINSPRPPKRMRSSFFMDSDMMDEELPHLESSKKPRDITVSSPMEAMTPLADDTLNILPDAQPDLDLHSPSATAAVIPKTTTRTKHVQQELLVEPSQHQQQIVTPKSLLKHQNQVKSAPRAPLSPDKSVNEMPTRQKPATLKPSAVVKSPTKPAHVQQQQQALITSPRKLTRRQARLIEESGGKPDFAVPQAPPPTKQKGRAPKRKQPVPKQAETIETPQETQPLEEAIVQQELPVDDDTLKQAIVEQQQESSQVVNANDATDVDMHVDDPLKEAAAVTVIEQKQEQEAESREAEKSDKVLQEEKLRAYRKKKSDAEIKRILEEFPRIAQYYQLIERAGSGTFSRVYKAKDLLVDEYMPSSQAKKVSDALGQDDTDARYVAIKLIFDISTPERVANEIQCLSMLEDSPGITPLITAFRHEGLTFVVLPYIQFDHFDDFYRDMTADDVRSYISELLTGLKSLHDKGYMHRDVKPGNFLYNVKSKAGYLADFGLARASSLKPNKPPTNSKVKNTQYTQKGDEIGYYAYDSRSSLQADRSGTKGFRAPEVMLRYRYQTSAIDIWAVGVILLTILSGQYPIFEPEDDANGIIELAHVFGMKQLKAFTEYYGRIIHTNIPTIPEDPVDLDSFCRDINKTGVEKWDPQEYASAVDLTKQCLQLIHTNRPTAADALNHPFFTSMKE